jgi:hypothetical protein
MPPKAKSIPPQFPVGKPPILQETGMRGIAYSSTTGELLVSLVPLTLIVAILLTWIFSS